MDITLPQHLDERLRWLKTPEEVDVGPGEFVLYWMHNALRAHENPALDAAICLARQNGLPLLVYHGLSEDYPYASDRHHSFLLQGHRDVQRQLSDRNIVAAFHLQRQGKRGPYLRTLTRAAAVLITEEMPVQPLTGWLERLVTTGSTPIATVDCSCIAPVTLADRPFHRAGDFREHVQPFYDQRLRNPYSEQPIDCAMCDLDGLAHRMKLEPLSLQDADLARLIGECRIDHTVAPVTDTPGGSRAGYARWETFKRSGLDLYHESRHNPARFEGTSRMSAYLHYGMVSPFRIAREAAAMNADKFLDELLTWREMSFHFCFHHRDEVDTLEAIPDWAQETLDKHKHDSRERHCSWETLARGKSERPLWDAAQRSLLKHGELHNHVRMTWGKSFLPWLHSPARALQLAIDLNHRYALDGRSPSSYGGIHWCYGQFDQPFQTEQAVLGRIRPHDASEMMSPRQLQRFQNHVDRPIAASVPRIAVIGAGIGGLTAARTLIDHGLDVTVFDKSRGVGGRTATRRAELPGTGESLSFDHGAQYFTARDSRFRRLVHSWIQDGLAEPWLGRIVQISAQGVIEEEKSRTPRYVGVPGMSALAKHLAKDLKLKLGERVVDVSHTGPQWSVSTTDGQQHDGFDLVICNCPPQQTLDLIGGKSDLDAVIGDVVMRGCWALMVADERLNEMDFHGAFVHDGILSWIAGNTSKPGRPRTPAWVIHASAEWSEQHLEDDPESVTATLLTAFETAIKRSLDSPRHAVAHRWRYALAAQPLDQQCLFDPVAGLGACGDWCGGSRVEAAFLSGAAMAGTILRRCTIDRAPYRSEQAVQPSLFAS